MEAIQVRLGFTVAGLVYPANDVFLPLSVLRSSHVMADVVVSVVLRLTR
jgi:hypothetical protein